MKKALNFQGIMKSTLQEATGLNFYFINFSNCISGVGSNMHFVKRKWGKMDGRTDGQTIETGRQNGGEG